MPMPPPKPSTEGIRDRQVTHEMQQIMRALHANGPQDARSLAEIVGAAALSGTDQLYLRFETEFERRVVDQGRREARSLDETFARCLDVLRVLPRRELSMLPADLLEDVFDDLFEPSEVREPRALDERAEGG